MRFVSLVLLAALVGTSATARPAQTANTAQPTVGATFKMTAETASLLVQQRTREIGELEGFRDQYCARGDETCTETFDDVINGRVAERGALERIRKLLAAENVTEAEKASNKKQADLLTLRYSVLNMGYTAMLNRLLDVYVRTRVTAVMPRT